MNSLPEMLGGWQAFVAAVLLFGAAPRTALRILVRVYPKNHPRRTELMNELDHRPYIERPLWVVEQMETAVFDGIPARWDHVRRQRRSSRLGGLLPLPLILPVVGLVGVLVAETFLLVAPINWILRSGFGFNLVATSAAAMLTGLSALVAHVRAKALARAEAATYGLAPDTESAVAVLATVGLLVAWAGAIAARGYMSYRTGDDPAGIVFFALSQTLLLAAGLVLPRWLLEARRALNEARL